MVKVEQIDREAASLLTGHVRNPAFNSRTVLEGMWDEHHIVQAFAKHRAACLADAFTRNGVAL